MIIKFADIVEKMSVIRCERSIITLTLTLFWLDYLVYRLSNCTMTLPTETYIGIPTPISLLSWIASFLEKFV